MINILHGIGFNTAYHVTPLHYLPNILINGELLSKDEVYNRGLRVIPRTSSQEKDRALGFSDFVHTFLLTWNHLTVRTSKKGIPILSDKLSKGFPHVCIKIPFEFFVNPVICYWNIAKGSPKGCSSNWSAESLLNLWETYREEQTNIGIIKGFFNEPMKVPTLINREQLEAFSGVVGNKIRGRCLELLQRNNLRIHPIGEVKATIEVFSERDLNLIEEYLPTEVKVNYNFTEIDPANVGYTYDLTGPSWNDIRNYFRQANWVNIPGINYD